MTKRKIDLLVIHCSATRCDRNITAADIDAAHRVRGFSSGGYHFFIRKDGAIEKMRPIEQVGAHAKGFNAHSIGICYEGGLDENGKPADTRTEHQRATLTFLVETLQEQYPEAKVLGHRDLSPDTNHNGRVDRTERIKECPCFEVKKEF